MDIFMLNNTFNGCHLSKFALLTSNLSFMVKLRPTMVLVFCLILTALVSGCDGDSSNSSSITVNASANDAPNTGSDNGPLIDCQNSALPFDVNLFAQPGIHLFVFGDSGTGNSNQKLVAQMLDTYHNQYPLDAIIHTGDVIYPSGISSKNDASLNSKFIDIYTPLSIADLDWYLVAGNHDYDGSVSALLDFAASQPFVHYDDRYYQQTIKSLSYDFQINLIATDTTPISKGVPQIEQLAWLNKQLLLSNGLTLVFGHHPILSNGGHGNSEILKANFYQLLKFYQVPLYLAGHEHSLEYLAPNSLPNMVVSGAGGQNLRSITCGKHSVYAEQAFGGFALYITEQSIWVMPLTERGIDRVFELKLAAMYH